MCVAAIAIFFAFYDWIIFTSVNEVDRFFRRLFDLGQDVRALNAVKVATIGPITADTARSLGFEVHVTAETHTIYG